MHLRCPRCATVIEAAPGTTPICPTCGFGGPVAPAPAAAPPTMAQPVVAPPPSVPAAPAPIPEHTATTPRAGPMAAGWALYIVGLAALVARIAMAGTTTELYLILVQLGIIIASAVLVYVDAKQLGVGRLPLARVKLSSTDRTTPGTWAVVVVLLWIITMPWYLSIRRRLALRVQQADAVGYFATSKEAKAARKAHRKLPDGTPYPVQ